MNNIALVNQALSIVARHLYTDEVREKDKRIRVLENKNSRNIRVFGRVYNHLHNSVRPCAECGQRTIMPIMIYFFAKYAKNSITSFAFILNSFAINAIYPNACILMAAESMSFIITNIIFLVMIIILGYAQDQKKLVNARSA